MVVLSGMAREPLCGFRERETKRRGERERERERAEGTHRDELNGERRMKERKKKKAGGEGERVNGEREKRQGENGSSRPDIMSDLNTAKRDASQSVRER